MFISHLESLGGQALCMSVGVGESWSSAAAPFSGAPRCQFNQPDSVILWHLCEHMHVRAHTPPPPGYGWANDSSPCSPHHPSSLSVSLFLCLSPSVQETSLRRAMRRKEASCWRRSSHRSKVRHSGLQEIYCPEQISLLWLAVGRGVNNLSWLEWKEKSYNAFHYNERRGAWFTVIHFFFWKNKRICRSQRQIDIVQWQRQIENKTLNPEQTAWKLNEIENLCAKDGYFRCSKAKYFSIRNGIVCCMFRCSKGYFGDFWFIVCLYLSVIDSWSHVTLGAPYDIIVTEILDRLKQKQV